MAAYPFSVMGVYKMNISVNAGFTEDMLKTLSLMKGKTLKSICGVFFHSLYESFDDVRLVLGQFAIDVSCNSHVEPLISYDNKIIYEDVSYFSCAKKRLSEKYVTSANDKPVSFIVNEHVSEVVLVRDDINVSNGEHYLVDRAFTIKTSEKAYTLFRKEIIDERIYISISDKIEGFQSIKEVKDSWDGEGRYSVDIDRNFLFL